MTARGPLPALDCEAWQTTKDALHAAKQVLRSTRLLGVTELPNELHYGALPERRGATTGPLQFGGELRLDYGRAEVVYENEGVEVFAVPLEGHTQTTLFDAVFEAFTDAGHALEPNRSKVVGSTPLAPDKKMAADYATVQWRMYEALARAKGRLLGSQTPIILWPHGFDLSSIWFPAGTNEMADPHVNIGFSPGTEDIGEPYVYFYAWPSPEGLPDVLPTGWEWQTEWGTPGGVMRYSTFADLPDPESTVATALSEVYRVVAPMLSGGLHIS